MKAFLLALFFVSTALQVPAANQAPKDPAPSQSTGDIDMNQFKNLESPNNPERQKDKKIKIQMTCTDPQGHIIKKGETGFDTCLANTQSPIMNNPRTPEPPNDPRSF